jgi:hypothetical protein
VMEALPSGILKFYPTDFVPETEEVDHYSLPDGTARVIEDMFHKPRLKFKIEQIEFRHRQQAELALALVRSGLHGPLAIPASSDTCSKTIEKWKSYWEGLSHRLDEEAAQRTPDDEKARAAVKLLHHWILDRKTL